MRKLTNEQLDDLAKIIKNNLDNLKTAAFNPANDLEIIGCAGALSARTGQFISHCLDIAYEGFMVDDGMETNG